MAPSIDSRSMEGEDDSFQEIDLASWKGRSLFATRLRFTRVFFFRYALRLLALRNFRSYALLRNHFNFLARIHPLLEF